MTEANKLPRPLRKGVQPLDELREERRDRLANELLEVARGLLVIEVEAELLSHVQDVGLAAQVLDLRVDHEHEQIEDERGARA